MRKWKLREELAESQNEVNRLRGVVESWHDMYERQSLGYGRVLFLIDGQRDEQFIPVGSVRAALNGTSDE